MSEVGCLKDGNFQNLQVEGNTAIMGTITNFIPFYPTTTLIVGGTSTKTADFTAAIGQCYLITKLDGCDVTLPVPTIGGKIKLVFGAVTSNAHTVTCDATTTLFTGYALLSDTADGTVALQSVVHTPDGTDDDAISMNGTTTGNGGIIELTGTATNRWYVEANLAASGSIATCFL